MNENENTLEGTISFTTNETGEWSNVINYGLPNLLSTTNMKIEEYHKINFDNVENLDDLIMVVKAFGASVGETNAMYGELKARGLLIE